MAEVQQVLIRLTDEEASVLDAMREDLSRPAWVKHLVMGAQGARERAGKPTVIYIINEDERARVWPTPTRAVPDD